MPGCETDGFVTSSSAPTAPSTQASATPSTGALPGRGLEVYARPAAGEAGLPRAAARPRVGQPARTADQKDVAGEETCVDALKGPVRPRGDSAVSVAWPGRALRDHKRCRTGTHEMPWGW